MSSRVFKSLACVLVLLLGSTVPSEPHGKPGGRRTPAGPADSMVKVWVLAEGHDRKLVLDLTAGDFQVSDDGRPQRLAYFAGRSPEPLEFGVLIENSLNRTYEPETADWRPYLSLLRKLLRPGDKAFVASFGEKAQLRGEFTNELPKLDQALQEVFTGKPPDDNPALYDSIVTLLR